MTRRTFYGSLDWSTNVIDMGEIAWIVARTG
jgi:hypothetical protein